MISLVGETRRVIVQGVYELFEKEPSTEWADEQRINRLVFIGERLLVSGPIHKISMLHIEKQHAIIIII